MRVGPLAVGKLSDWEPGPGATVSWEPSPAAIAKALEAPVSNVPTSYMQSQHIRGYCEQKAKGLDYSRLMIVSCDQPGRCDIRAVNYIVNAHLRRHDTYRSRFEYTDDGRIVRRAIPDPEYIEFVPVRRGALSQAQIRDLVVSTPEPLQWDCFRFGVIQGDDHFTFYASVDHVHADAMLIGLTLMEFRMMYGALVGGGAPLELPRAGSYDEYCIREYGFTATLTAESPQVRAWMSFTEQNAGSTPDFPLPLGDASKPCDADFVSMRMLDDEQTRRFESACLAAGARFVGGVLACCGLADYELAGGDSYYGLTPRDTRRPGDAMTQGWFTGWIPITVPIAGLSFDDAARAAQVSFDSGQHLAEVPYDRVVELAPTVQRPRPNFPVVNFLDASTSPLSVLLSADLDNLNIGIYSDNRYSYQLSIFVIRVERETVAAVFFPDNPIAQESIARYLAALRSVFVRVADIQVASSPRL